MIFAYFLLFVTLSLVTTVSSINGADLYNTEEKPCYVQFYEAPFYYKINIFDIINSILYYHICLIL